MNYVTWDALDFDSTIRDFDFTRRAVRKMNSVVYSAEFEDMDSDTIFRYLFEQMELVSFKDYLKRYIYEQAQIEEPFRQVSDETYKDILTFSFDENSAPHSFEPTTKKWGAIIKGWLTQDSVKRSAVFLLGFGLRMSGEDVSEFLTKVLKEEDIREDDPEEVIYYYCISHGLKYAKAKQLIEQYKIIDIETGKAGADIQPVRNSKKRIFFAVRKDESQEPVVEFRAIQNENDLMDYLRRIKKEGGQDKGRDKAREWFIKLLDRTKDVIVRIYQNDEDNQQCSKRIWVREDVTAGDVERIICSGIPLTKTGNLQKMSSSVLAKHFRQKRMSRQRIDSILAGETLIDRFDLITLLFFIYSQEQENMEPEIRCRKYIDDINSILKECRMMVLHPVNPYESFVLMCLLSETPLATYSEIWEISYGR